MHASSLEDLEAPTTLPEAPLSTTPPDTEAHESAPTQAVATSNRITLSEEDRRLISRARRRTKEANGPNRNSLIQWLEALDQQLELEEQSLAVINMIVANIRTDLTTHVGGGRKIGEKAGVNYGAMQ